MTGHLHDEPDWEQHYHDDEEPSAWVPVDLLPAWRGKVTRPAATVYPRSDGEHLLPPGVNWIHGDSGDGKSWIALVAAFLCMKACTHVVWVTYEDTNEHELVDRLRLLGAVEDDLEHLTVLLADSALTEGAAALVDIVQATSAVLLVLDSVGEALATGGLDENKDADVGPWIRKGLRAIAKVCPTLAVWAIDHSTKAKDNPLYPSGSKRKRAAVTGRGYLLNVRQPWAVGVVGRVQLVVAKDRTGRFRRGEIAAEITLDATTTPYEIITAPGTPGDTITTRKRTAVARVEEVLEGASVPLGADQIARIANAPDRKRVGESDLEVKTVQNALGKLAKGPQVQRIGGERDGTGRRTRATWILTDPDRDEEHDDAA